MKITRTHGAPKVLLLDLWCVVPYYTGALCKALTESGVDVTLASISYQYDTTYFARMGVRNDPGLFDIVARIGIGKARLRQVLKLLECVVNFLALAVRVAIRRADIVHVQFIPLVKKRLPFELWFLRFARWRGGKLVYTVHNELPMDTGEKHFETFRAIYHMADLLICHTPESRSRVSERFGVPLERIRVVPHGPILHVSGRRGRLPSRQALGFAPDAYIVLWQGWVKPYKGVPLLLEAWQQLQARGSRARLVIAGTGKEHLLREIRASTERLGLAASVQLELRFMAAEELSLYYEAADVVVYPYKEITTSGALMTGMSYGKAIIATAVPGFQEILQHGRCAWLVPPGDSGALAGAIEYLGSHPEIRSVLAEEAGKAAEARQTSWRAIGRATGGVYSALVPGTMKSSGVAHAANQSS